MQSTVGLARKLRKPRKKVAFLHGDFAGTNLAPKTFICTGRSAELLACALAWKYIMDSEALSQFVSLTDSTPDAAKFFLESANGNVEAAIDQYFASGGQAQQQESVPAAVEQHQAAPATAITPASVSAAASAPAKKPAAGEQATRLIRNLGRLDLATLGNPCQNWAVATSTI